jgi:hypothetical protein
LDMSSTLTIIGVGYLAEQNPGLPGNPVSWGYTSRASCCCFGILSEGMMVVSNHIYIYLLCPKDSKTQNTWIL